MPHPPIQWRRLVPVLAAQFTESFSMMTITPLLPFIVADYFPDVPSGQIGYYSGALTSAFYFGQLSSAPLWGALSDHIGRKPCLLLGLLGLLISILAFGASPTFEWALAARFTMGLLNGTSIVCKAYIPEICVLAGQVALAMGLLSLQWSLGSICGPIIGGMLAKPTVKYPDVFTNVAFLDQYPFALSLAVPWVAALLVFFLVAFSLPGHSNVSEETNPLAPSVQVDKGISKERQGSLFTKAVILCTTLYTGIGILAASFHAIFPLYLSSGQDLGGYGLDSSQVGLLLSLGGCLQLIWQPFVFPVLSGYFGFRPLCAVAFLGYGSILFSVPFTNLLPDIDQLRWAAMIALCIAGNICTATAFSSLAVMVSFSVPAHLRGRVNGVSQMVSSAARVVCPAAASIVFAWSVGSGYNWPLDIHLAFHLLGLLGFVASMVATVVPDSVEKPYLTSDVARLSVVSE